MNDDNVFNRNKRACFRIKRPLMYTIRPLAFFPQNLKKTQK